jgi:SHS2 domain-containing protein
VAERGNGGVSPDLMPRLGMTDWIRPLTRCTMCNGLLAQASAAEVVDRVPPGTLYHQRRFTVCTACSKVYWKGAHHVRISRLIAGAMRHPGTGHRTLPHTADIRIEAWAPGREQCIAEAVRGMVDTFADTSRHGETAVREVRVPAQPDADLLTSVLDEVIYRLDTDGEIPIDVQITATDDALIVRFTMADADSIRPIGAVPKAVSLHELQFVGNADGWSCAVTLDV